jgi:UrcA family protein
MRAQTTARSPVPQHRTAAHAPHHHHAGMRPAAVIGAAVAGALIALAFGATSAAAQTAVAATERTYYDDGSYVDEVVVTPLYRDRDRNRISRIVSIRDLDLTTLAGREVLRVRIRDTAREICRELGEDRFTGSMLTSSCVDQAIRDTRPQVRLAQRQAWNNRTYAYLDTPYPYDFRVYP